jgi:hypothetical protein
MIRPGHESDLFYETAAQGWQLISVLPISRGEASDKALFCPPYLALRKEHPMDKIVVMYVKKDSHSQVLPWIWHQDDESEELVGLYIKGN